MKPLFITFEGGEGAGKTSLIDKLEQTLTRQGYSVIRTREPGGSILSETIRKWVLEHNNINLAPMTELLLFLAARSQHIFELIAPALQKGQIVLCDRFNDSTIAYQGGARGLGIDKVTALCELVTAQCQPDLTLYLDVDPTIGLARSRRTSKDTAKAGELDKIESQKLQFHESVRESFLLLTKKFPKRIHLIDAHQDREHVYKNALAVIEERLAPHHV